MREKIDVNWSWSTCEDHAKLQLPKSILRNGRVRLFVKGGTAAGAGSICKMNILRRKFASVGVRGMELESQRCQGTRKESLLISGCRGSGFDFRAAEAVSPLKIL
jgi:hypothetical protein